MAGEHTDHIAAFRNSLGRAQHNLLVESDTVGHARFKRTSSLCARCAAQVNP